MLVLEVQNLEVSDGHEPHWLHFIPTAGVVLNNVVVHGHPYLLAGGVHVHQIRDETESIGGKDRISYIWLFAALCCAH